MADHIVDTSPLYYLHRAGILHVLPAIFGRVIVPGQVVAELSAGRARGHDLPDPLVQPWADVRTVSALSPELESFVRLGAGEHAVLTLAMTIPGSVAILDDLLARRVAEGFEVPVTGTLHVILVAKERGLVPAVRPLLDRLQELRFRMSTDLRDEILTSAGEG